MSNNDELHLTDLSMNFKAPQVTVGKEIVDAESTAFIDSAVALRIDEFLSNAPDNRPSRFGTPDEITVQISAKYGNVVTSDTMNLYVNDEGNLTSSIQGAVIEASTPLNAKKLYDSLSRGLADDLSTCGEAARQFGSIFGSSKP